ncbi:helix-turn-helix transcriptional regulator [Methanocella conradii]|uniref:helix-turn-helix transcriptional regulator n=1 Tax=Methanocella conradii TaxID=1175444 RepID=UPI0024B3368D|nr:winged helix-turn-helix domain-containing protein [Methanocella conradii]MDI6898190.1 winged helix-turn-helix domain-containing protein [Methanocella conradii]
MSSSSLLDYLASSRVRKNVLYRLLEGSLSLKELCGAFNTSPSSIIPRLKELESIGLICKEDGKYCLTFTGVEAAKKLIQTERVFGLLERYPDFFNVHDLSVVPENLLDRLDVLGECRLVQNSLDSVNATWEVVERLEGSSSLAGISPMFDSRLPGIILSIARRGTPLSIILTRSIYEKVASGYKNDLREFLSCENARLYVIGEARLALVVTDSFLALSLFKGDGFDAQTSLMSREKSALKWGEELFEYYKQGAMEIKP